MNSGARFMYQRGTNLEIAIEEYWKLSSSAGARAPAGARPSTEKERPPATDGVTRVIHKQMNDA